MSRDLSDLREDVGRSAEVVAEMFEAASDAARLPRREMVSNVDILIYCTYRSDEEQARLYRQGRSRRKIEAKAEELDRRWSRPDLARVLMAVGPQDGKSIITYAAPGQSAHGYRVAFDAVPIVDGKVLWEQEDPWKRSLWDLYGSCVDAAGLEWAGQWSVPKRELVHAQVPFFDWREWI